MPFSEDDGFGGVRQKILAGWTAILTGDFSGKRACRSLGGACIAALAWCEDFGAPLLGTDLRGCQASTGGALEPNLCQWTAAFEDHVGDTWDFTPDAWKGLTKRGAVGEVR